MPNVSDLSSNASFEFELAPYFFHAVLDACRAILRLVDRVGEHADLLGLQMVRQPHERERGIGDSQVRPRLTEHVRPWVLFRACPLAVDQPPEGRDPGLRGIVGSREDQRGNGEDGEDVRVGDQCVDRCLVVRDPVVLLLGQLELAAVDAALAVDHVEVGLDALERVAVGAAERVRHRRDAADVDGVRGDPRLVHGGELAVALGAATARFLGGGGRPGVLRVAAGDGRESQNDRDTQQPSAH